MKNSLDLHEDFIIRPWETLGGGTLEKLPMCVPDVTLVKSCKIEMMQ